jgi:hypothetical protein
VDIIAENGFGLPQNVVDHLVSLGKDPGIYKLGQVCKRGHDFNGEGFSIRNRKCSSCILCKALRVEKHKEKIAEQQKIHYQKNKERISEKGEQYYQENKEIICQRVSRYQEENIEAINLRRKQYRQENKEKIAQHREATTEKRRMWKKQWDEKNREWRRTYRKNNNDRYALHTRKRYILNVICP